MLRTQDREKGKNTVQMICNFNEKNNNMVQCRSEREKSEEDTVQRILSESMPKYMAEKAALFPALLFFFLI